MDSGFASPFHYNRANDEIKYCLRVGERFRLFCAPCGQNPISCFCEYLLSTCQSLAIVVNNQNYLCLANTFLVHGRNQPEAASSFLGTDVDWRPFVAESV